jgi:arylsulfatase A-like enzyme
VTDLDTQVGRLLGELKKMDLADSTLILFSSDNGPEDIHVLNALRDNLDPGVVFWSDKGLE